MSEPDKRFFHIMVGQPDENCEVCRAHGLVGHELPAPHGRISIHDLGTLDELFRCSCPLCIQLQFEPFEDDPASPQ